MATISPPPDLSTSRDPIRANQQTFRRALEALGMPGRLQQLTAHPQLRTADLPADVQWPATLLLMLLDHEVSLFVDDFANAEPLRDLLQRRTRVATGDAATAAVAVSDITTLTPQLITTLRRGSLHYPDDGATLVVLVDDLTVDPTATLTGPGVDGEIAVALPGFTAELLAARETAVGQYPIGIDLFVLDRAGRLLGLPRTTTISTGTEV